MPERKVHHPKYGRGIVKQTRHKGFELKSRRMIEAFRLGIVPYDCVEEFTFGRDEETRRVMDWLNSSDESTLLIIGEYGTGKTHLLHYARSIALQNEFAVAWVEMDPNEAPFHKPKRVYNHLLKNLKYRPQQSGQLKGFRDFLRDALRQGAFQDHIYFKHLIEHNDEVFWEWIEGFESIPRPVEWIENYWGYLGNKYQFLPGLYDYSTAANIYCYLLSGLGWAAKEILGLRGLLLIFDEAETVDMYYYSYQAERSRNFLKALIRTAADDRSLCHKAENAGLDYCKVGAASTVPFCYRVPCGLKLLYAFTPTYGLYGINELQSLPCIKLSPLTDQALKEVFEHIRRFYNSSYGFLEEDLSIIDKTFRKVNTQSRRTRLFVKGSVEALDLVRFNPGKILDEILQ